MTSKYADTPLVRYLQEVMRRREWSGNELARRAGLTSPSFWELMTGATKNPALDTVMGLAEACGVDPVVIFSYATGYRPPTGLDPMLEELKGIFVRLPNGSQGLLLRLAFALADQVATE